MKTILLSISLSFISINILANDDNFRADGSTFKQTPEARKNIYKKYISKMVKKLKINDSQLQTFKEELITYLRNPSKNSRVIELELELNACNEKINNLVALERDISNRSKTGLKETEQVIDKMGQELDGLQVDK